jgi:hypothetical protein
LNFFQKKKKKKKKKRHRRTTFPYVCKNVLKLFFPIKHIRNLLYYFKCYLS